MAAFAKDKRVHIRADVDRHFREALRNAATRAPAVARFHIRAALENGPSRGGGAEAMAFFGSEIDVKLKLTAPLIDGIEINAPGFKKWLQATGFGNDLRMIRGFVDWAEHVSE